MIKEDTWYRIWTGHKSRMIEENEAHQLLSNGRVYFVDEESFYDSKFGIVTVLHYVKV